jgi:hypothetical protein
MVPPYDPDVIERFALRLERRAVAVRRGMTVTGAAFGALVGSVPLTPLHVAWPVPQLFGFAPLMGGLAVGALIGYVVGDGRAEIHRLHAQTTLCSLHAQRTSLAIWRLLENRDEPVAAPAPTPAPEPEPVPVAAAPVQPRLPEPLPDLELELEPEPEPEFPPEPLPLVANGSAQAAPAPVREAVRLASVPTSPSLRPAGVSAPPLQPPPLTG